MDNKQNGNLIDDHRKALMLSGNLSDWQVTNLKSWPNIVFDHIKDFDLIYDFTEDSKDKETGEIKKTLCAGKVIYDLRFSEEPQYSQDELHKRLEDLKSWIRVMFWRDTKIIIKKEGKKWI